MKECILYLLIQKKAAHKTKHMSHPIVCIFPVILFGFVILTISNYLLPSTLPSPFCNLDVKLLIS